MNLINKIISKTSARLISILYPDFCIICGDYGLPICLECESRLAPSRKVLTPFSIALYDYKDESVRKVIKSLKYNNDVSLAKYISKNLAPKIKDISHRTNKKLFVLLPIPIHKGRLSRRGYNQSKIIADGLASIINQGVEIRVCDALQKHKSTDNLYKATSVESRLESLRNSMSLDTKKFTDFVIKNKIEIEKVIFVLTDDVSTTGATIYEAKRAIVEADLKFQNYKIKPDCIYALTLAN